MVVLQVTRLNDPCGVWETFSIELKRGIQSSESRLVSHGRAHVW
jgi:hypothetical protein